MFGDLEDPSLHLMKVFLMRIDTEKGDSVKLKVKLDFLIKLRIYSLVSLASILMFYLPFLNQLVTVFKL